MPFILSKQYSVHKLAANHLTRFVFIVVTVLAAIPILAQEPPSSRPATNAVVDRITDAYVPVWTEITAASSLGQRMLVNQDQRLKKVDIDKQLIMPYVKKSKSWSGEYVGKYLHSAVLAWQSSHDLELKRMIDETVKNLIVLQEPDGYLGVEPTKSGDWNVWCHKYALVGLLSYYQATGDANALAAARKLGDYMVTKYGTGKTAITQGASHVGMSAISVLEPLTGLYRVSGNEEHLNLCRHVMDEQSKRKMVEGLLSHGSVKNVCNAKAYEMTSCFVGFLEYYRLTGEKPLLDACEKAWSDIVTKRAYITGTASWNEHFGGDYELPAQDAGRGMGEGCVSFSLMQLNWELLRLTGKACYADELERISYNAVLGAQSPRTGQLCYYMPLVGKKSYGQGPTMCCAYNLPRALAMIPACIAGTAGGQPTIVLYSPFRGTFPVTATNGKPVSVTVQMETDYPSTGKAVVTVTPERPADFRLRLRVPLWCTQYHATMDGRTVKGEPGAFLELQRSWKNGDKVSVEMDLPLRILAGGDGKPLGKSYPDKVALQRGPQVLATDDSVTEATLPTGWIGKQVYAIKVMQGETEKQLILVPYADVGQSGSAFHSIFDALTIKKQ